MPLIVKDLIFHRGGRPLFTDLSFQVKFGSVLTVFGPNGSGKTTLLKILSGIMEPHKGQIDHKSSFHYIGHLNALKGELTVYENLKAFALLHGLKDSHDRILASLHSSHLNSLSICLVRTLSAGQKRQVSLARLSLVDKKLWILDEPTSHLDTQATHRFWDYVTQHVNNGGAAIIASHDVVPLQGTKTLVLHKQAVYKDSESRVFHLSPPWERSPQSGG